MPCCGKTTVGMLLSKRINYKFIDTDLLIQSKNNSSVQDIINLNGEEYFRKLEKGLVENFISDRIENTVISTGGGMPVFNDNLNTLKSVGTTFFLNTPIEELILRAREGEIRPLLKGKVEERIRELYLRRIDIYKQCDYEINTGKLSPENIICDILIKVGKI